MVNVKGLHLEPTNKCTLKCPRCPRTSFIDTFGMKSWKNEDLNLDHLKKFLDIDLKNIKIRLCGNLGDPIYYDDLFNLIQWTKEQGGQLEIVTNGSYRRKDWWEKHLDLLDEKDSLVFSIDGVPSNFTEYRVNGDWNSIETAIACAVNSKVTTSWKYIPFSFNENDIDHAKQLSNDLGIDNFIIYSSDRWEQNDYLKPVNDLYHGPRTEKIIEWRNSGIADSIDPKCYNSSEHFISAKGYYAPCCYSADWRFYYSSKFWKNKEQYDISKTTFTKVLLQEDEFFKNLEIRKEKYCTFNCPKT